MAQDVQSFTVTIPAGTLSSSPYSLTLDIGNRIVTRVEIRVPPGPLGNVGFAIQESGTTAIPSNGATWIIANDESMVWDLNGFIESGRWGLIGYNTGAYNHSIYVRFICDYWSVSVAPVVTPIPAGVLAGP